MLLLVLVLVLVLVTCSCSLVLVLLLRRARARVEHKLEQREQERAPIEEQVLLNEEHKPSCEGVLMYLFEWHIFQLAHYKVFGNGEGRLWRRRLVHPSQIPSMPRCGGQGGVGSRPSRRKATKVAWESGGNVFGTEGRGERGNEVGNAQRRVRAVPTLTSLRLRFATR